MPMTPASPYHPPRVMWAHRPASKMCETQAERLESPQAAQAIERKVP